MPVTYASQHLLMTFHGGLPGGENWSIGLRTQAADVPEADMQDYAYYAANCYEQFMKDDSYNTFINTKTTFEGCTLRQIGTNGLTVFLAEAPPVAVSVGVGTAPIPNQCCLVVSLLTPKAGRSGKGRVYLPLTALNSSEDLATGGLPIGRNGVIAAAFAKLVQALNGSAAAYGAAITMPAPALGFRLAVQSTKPPGAQSPITSIGVGNIIDTQRGRRSKLVELRATVPIPTPVYTG